MMRSLRKISALVLTLALALSVLGLSASASEYNGWSEEKAAVEAIRSLMENSDSLLYGYLHSPDSPHIVSSADAGSETVAFTVTQEIPAETPAEAASETPAEVPAEAASEAPAEAASEAPAEAASEAPAEVPAEAPAEESGTLTQTLTLNEARSVPVTLGQLAAEVNGVIASCVPQGKTPIWRIFVSSSKTNVFFGFLNADGTTAEILMNASGIWKSGTANVRDGALLVRGSGTDEMTYGASGNQSFEDAAAPASFETLLHLFSGDAVDKTRELTYATASDKTMTLPREGEGTVYTVTGIGSGTNHIVVTDDVTLYLSDVTISNLDTGLSAIEVKSGAAATILVSGSASLTGGQRGCGIAVPEGAVLKLSGATGNDSLTAVGTGTWGCGIGWFVKDGSAASGSITISDLSALTAAGGCAGLDLTSDHGVNEGGPAIGGGRTSNTADQTQNGVVTLRNIASVTATGGAKAAAIGAGFWRACDVLIENCANVAAVGGTTAAAIGISRNNTEGDSSVTIRGSAVTAQGGYYGAGIGTGYYDNSYGDFSRDAALRQIPAMNITIGGSVVTATGGKLAAAIGGGYKSWNASVSIDASSTVTAYAGANGGNGQKIPCAIGSGADGSGIFADRGSLSIAAGADVAAFAYGYETADGSVLASKWAISRELNDSSTTANVLQCRFLTSDFYGENAMTNSSGSALYSEALGVLSAGQSNVATLTNGTATRTVTIPAGYTCMAVTVDAGTWTVRVNDRLQSYLPTASCSAATDGSFTGTASAVYTHGSGSGSYAAYAKNYNPYGTKSDLVSLAYSFNTPSADFAVSAGVNSFDAVAYRPGVTPTPVPEPTPTPTPDPEPTPTPTPVPGGDDDSTPASPVTLPEEPTPAAEVPGTEEPSAEIPEEETPLAEVPATGDSGLAALSGFCAAASLAGLAYVALSGRKKKDEA